MKINVQDKSLALLSDDNENPRAGWSDAFKKMAQVGDDKLLDPMIFELESDIKEWKWIKF